MSPILLDRFDKTAGAIAVDTLVAFCSTPDLDVRALADAVEDEIATAPAPDEMLVLVRASGFDEAVEGLRTTTQGAALLERLRGRCRVEIVGFDADGREAGRVELAPDGLASGSGLAEIVRRGTTSIFARRGGFVEASASYHFANPSGAHTDRFMRLSNILVRQAEIAFIALAVMRRLPPDARQAYIDTPSLYAVVSAINEHWRTLAPDRPTLAADNFSSYFGFETHRFTDVARSIALISASSSGRLGRRLVDEKGFDPNRIVHVLYLGPGSPGPNVGADLGADLKDNPAGFSTERRTFKASNCALCRAGSVAITLKGDQFDIAGPQHPPLLIVRADAPKTLAATMRRLAGTGGLRVTPGPRLFDVDAAALLASRPFQDRLDYLVRRQVPAGVEAVVLVDAAAESIAARASATAGGLPAPVGRAAVPAMRDGRTAPFTGAILVVASVIGSGRLLLDVSRDLRNVAPEAPIIYLVGFAKVQDPERREAFNRSLVQTDRPVKHVVECVDELLLPANPETNAWDDELAFLERNRGDCLRGADEFVDARLKRLRETSRPLIDDLYLPDHADAALKLREGFVFWPADLPGKPHSQADVLFTIASVLQQLRTAGPQAGERTIRANWMQQTILSPENFGRFNDGIIQASLLRSARPAELDFRDDPTASGDAGRLIRRIVESATRPRGEAAAEFLLALGTGTLRLCPRDADAVLADLDGAPALVAALMEMCRAERRRASQPTRRNPPRRRRSQTARPDEGTARPAFVEAAPSGEGPAIQVENRE